MKRRSRAGGEPIKGRRRKTSEPKRRNAPNAVPRLSSSTAEEAEAASLTRELNEAREHQAATSEVLKVISGSHGDLQPVFAAMLENARGFVTPTSAISFVGMEMPCGSLRPTIQFMYPI
jgi:hypothetical protein